MYFEGNIWVIHDWAVLNTAKMPLCLFLHMLQIKSTPISKMFVTADIL